MRTVFGIFLCLSAIRILFSAINMSIYEDKLLCGLGIVVLLIGAFILGLDVNKK